MHGTGETSERGGSCEENSRSRGSPPLTSETLLDQQNVSPAGFILIVASLQPHNTVFSSENFSVQPSTKPQPG